MNPHYSDESLNSYFIKQIKDYAIFATDTNGIISTWNKGCERIKGYTPEETIGQYYGMLHPDEYQQAGKPQEELDKALENGVYDVEDWRKRKDGSLFWASVTLTPIYSAEGEHVGYTKITGDITKQKELQDKLAERQQGALEHKNDQLHKINLDLDNFIYTASHDLRSPITNIEALVQVLQEELTQAGNLNQDTEEIVQRITASINRLKRTIDDLTEINRLHKDFSENPSAEIINIKEVYEDIIADLGFVPKQEHYFVKTDFQVHQLKFSRKNFRSILYNLISNAIKYQSPERDCIININTRLEEPFVLLSVEDNGLGMNARQQEQLYTMFKRFHDHVEGTGVGLFMVKRILDNAGGKIEVKSEEDKGTEFKVYFKAEM
ncbi:hypothetical protein AAE02nite_28730 [Adhaeribacter aerolatus]|uniref:histidine kinase n=1 Tax=Adhaeribacter aerolatus TaxID=670289 RepID=A0A512AZS3_9BACT|nr:PAS domain-containing sensor histidine kinase [Adhaeribacter aerolatus]GEO05209.1 hypothetical protein AAE02nite_28730 [Adhaeribacter aerolatus]